MLVIIMEVEATITTTTPARIIKVMGMLEVVEEREEMLGGTSGVLEATARGVCLEMLERIGDEYNTVFLLSRCSSTLASWRWSWRWMDVD